MGEWLQFPVQWIDTDVSKAGPGTVEGYASVWNVVDNQDDVVTRGAFKRTLAAWKASGRRIPLVADHRHSSEGVIGSIVDAREDAIGLRFRAEFSTAKAAQDVRLKAKEKHLDGVSIFGDILQKSVEMVDGRPIRILSELKLMEISLTPFPANEKALVSAVKSGLDVTGQAPLDEAWVKDMRAALEIGSAPVRKAAVDLLIAAYRGAPAAPEGTPTAGDGGGDNQDVSDEAAAKYALAIIGESGPDGSPPGGNPSSNSLADLLAPLDAAATTTDLNALEAEIKQINGS